MDLLVGIGLGLAVSAVTVLYQQWLVPYSVADAGPGAPVRLVLSENVSFFNKAPLQHALESIPDGGAVVVDARRRSTSILTSLEMLDEYHANAASRGVDFTILGDPRGRAAVPPVVRKRYLERKIATSLRGSGDGAAAPVSTL